MRYKTFAFGVSAAIALVACVVTMGGTANSAGHGEGQNNVVHLTSYSNDLHAAFMALKLANGMQAQDAEVTLFLDLEGVRMADTRVPLDVMWGTAHAPLAKYFGEFVDAGGKITLCPHCAAAAGIGEDHLREGASIGTDAQIAMQLIHADKILDY